MAVIFPKLKLQNCRWIVAKIWKPGGSSLGPRPDPLRAHLRRRTNQVNTFGTRAFLKKLFFF